MASVLSLRGRGAAPPRSIEFVHEAAPAISKQDVCTRIYNIYIVGHRGRVPSIIKIPRLDESDESCGQSTGKHEG